MNAKIARSSRVQRGSLLPVSGCVPVRVLRSHRQLCLLLSAAICLLLCTLSAFSQTASLRTYNNTDGLRSLAIECLVQDGSANIWVCTYNGLYRYEGDRFLRVGQETGLQDAYIVSVAPAAGGSGLWVATAGNLYFWDGLRATRIVDPDGAPIPFLNGDIVTAFQGGAVAASGKRALRITAGAHGWQAHWLFDAETERTHSELSTLRAVYSDTNTLWFGCWHTICRRAPDGRVSVFTPQDGVQTDSWSAFLRDSHGVLWARGHKNIVVFDAATSRFVKRMPPGTILSSAPRRTDLVEDNEGRILTRSDTGLMRWDRDHWEDLSHYHGFPEASPISLLNTRAGDIWLAYSGLGVLHWRGYSGVENWGPADGLAGVPVWSILRDQQGSLLIGNERGIHSQSKGQLGFAEIPSRPGLPIRDVYVMQPGVNGTVWAGLYGGHLLGIHDSHLQSVFTLPAHIISLFFDSRARLWICSTSAMYVSDKSSNWIPRRFPGLPPDSYYSAVEDKHGHLWVVGAKGVTRLEGDKATHISIEGSHHTDQIENLVVSKDDQLWPSTDANGLFSSKSGDTLHLEPVQDALLQDSMPIFIRQDSKGRLWVGGTMGVDVLHNGHWTKIDETNGLISNDTDDQAFYEDKDGSIWIGTPIGASHLLNPDQLLDRQVPVLKIERVERDQKTILPGASLAWSSAPMRITLSTPGSVTGPEALHFKYRLSRQDRWIETSSRILDFPSLYPGDVTVEVQAFDFANRSQSDLVTFSFTLRPPWWRSAPALGLWAGLALAVVALLWRWRTRSLLARHRQLEQLVIARTSDLEAEKRELEKTRAALQVQATHDGLTGLRNRTSIMNLLKKEMEYASIHGSTLAVALIDLDHFKEVNDTHGHLIGDAVLSSVSARLSQNLRGSDVIGRYGGEELLLIMPGLLPPSTQRLEELRLAVAACPIAIEGGELNVTCSIGVAWLTPAESYKELLHRADEALYQAKREGRDRIVLATV